MNKLPIAIVIPHAGLAVPPEVNGRIALTPGQIFNEADVYVDQIFDFRDQVLHWVNFPYARAILDMNRLDDPARIRPGDGIVKWQTSYGDPIYLPNQRPDEAEERQLIARYWQAWHEQLAAIAADERVKLVLDAHSMAAVGPGLYDDPGVLRPRVGVANLGDEAGNVEECGYISATAALTREFAEVLGQRLGQLAAWTETGEDWALNRPFWGGADLQIHGRSPHTQPWLMVEINRALYIGKQSGNTPIVLPDAERIAILQTYVWQSLEKIIG